MALTDAMIRQTRPGEKPIKLGDGQGLYLHIAPSGARTWRLRTQVAGRESVRILGRYPAMSLAQARQARDRLRDQPAALGSVTLAEAVREWHATQAPRWRPHHAADVLASLEREALPTLGRLRLGDVTAPMILAVLRGMEQRGAIETAHRVRQRLAAVYAHAMAAGQAASNPATGLERAMAPIVRQRHRPALVGLEEARAMLTRAEAIPAHPVTRLALRLLALTAVRPGELRAAEWTEFATDGDAPTWTIPPERMKHTREQAADIPAHVVPLSRQAVDALRILHRLTGHGRLAFPSLTTPGRPMSENALGYLLNRAGFAGRHVPHGWRATFATVMNERFPGDRAVIDLMLAHVPKDPVERAYNRARHDARRRELAQAWADLLLQDLPPAEALLDLPRRSAVGGSHSPVDA